MMKRNVALTATIVLGLLLMSGCASSPSRRDILLHDLVRELDAKAPPAALEADDRLPTSEALSASRALPDTDFPVQAEADAAPDSLSSRTLTIQPDSILRIRVGEDPGLNGSYTVNDLGAIQLGYIGPVILYDLTEEGAAEKIRDILLAREFHAATVDVKLLRPSYDKVRISGAVKRPGLIRLGAGDEVTLNNALSQVGGITESPWNARVKIVRGGLQSILAPYLPGEVYAFSDEDRRPVVPQVTLRNNDVAFVYSRVPERNATLRARPRWVLVLGEVSNEGFYRFSPSERFTLMNLIFRMGGLPPYANDKAVRIIREDDDGIEHEYRVNAREILKEGDPDLDFDLQSGDRVIVPAKRITLL